jgi:hypothetical protein
LEEKKMKKFYFYGDFIIFHADKEVENIRMPYEVTSAIYDEALEKALMLAQASVRAYEADGSIAFFRIVRKPD